MFNSQLGDIGKDDEGERKEKEKEKPRRKTSAAPSAPGNVGIRVLWSKLSGARSLEGRAEKGTEGGS